MDMKITRIAETCALSALTIINLSASVLAGPPPPPVILDQVPRTPVGAIGVSIATAVGIAAYGMWKSRR
jgi:hypothetical protein